MRTPTMYTKNLKNHVITTQMLLDCLFSVNKRAKNYRDQERKYRHMRYDYYDNEEKNRSKKEEYVKCPVEYKWVESGTFFYFWKAQFYVKSDGKKNVLGEYTVYREEYPSNYIMEEVPEKFRSDFRMVWKKAHDEVVQLKQESLNQSLNQNYSEQAISTDKTILKKFYRVLANTYHPDNNKTGDPEMMQYASPQY